VRRRPQRLNALKTIKQFIGVYQDIDGLRVIWRACVPRVPCEYLGCSRFGVTERVCDAIQPRNILVE